MFTNIRTIWILPHRDPSGEIMAAVEGSRVRLVDAIDVENLPKELCLGVPEEVLRRCPGQDVVFAQFVRRDDHELFLLAVKCGKDIGGRTVYLCLLEELANGAQPNLFPPTDGLGAEELAKVRELTARQQSGKDRWFKSVDKMLRAAHRHPKLRSYSNISTPKAVFPSEWTGDKTVLQIAILIIIIILSIAMVLLFCKAVWQWR